MGSVPPAMPSTRFGDRPRERGGASRRNGPRPRGPRHHDARVGRRPGEHLVQRGTPRSRALRPRSGRRERRDARRAGTPDPRSAGRPAGGSCPRGSSRPRREGVPCIAIDPPGGEARGRRRSPGRAHPQLQGGDPRKGGGARGGSGHRRSLHSRVRVPRRSIDSDACSLRRVGEDGVPLDGRICRGLGGEHPDRRGGGDLPSRAVPPDPQRIRHGEDSSRVPARSAGRSWGFRKGSRWSERSRCSSRRKPRSILWRRPGAWRRRSPIPVL